MTEGETWQRKAQGLRGGVPLWSPVVLVWLATPTSQGRPQGDAPTESLIPLHKPTSGRPEPRPTILVRTHTLELAHFSNTYFPGAGVIGGYFSLPTDGGATLSPERGFSHSNQSIHQLPS
jgi:hypothetical protein